MLRKPLPSLQYIFVSLNESRDVFGSESKSDYCRLRILHLLPTSTVRPPTKRGHTVRHIAMYGKKATCLFLPSPSSQFRDIPRKINFCPFLPPFADMALLGRILRRFFFLPSLPFPSPFLPSSPPNPDGSRHCHRMRDKTALSLFLSPFSA